MKLDVLHNSSRKSLDNKIGNEVENESNAIDDLLADVVTKDTTSVINPILDRVLGSGYQGGPILAQFSSKDQEKITNYLNLPEVRRLLPVEFRYIKFAWGKSIPDSDILDLYVLKSNRDNLAPLSGGVVVDASFEAKNK